MNSLCTDIINSILIPYITVLYHKLFIPRDKIYYKLKDNMNNISYL